MYSFGDDCRLLGAGMSENRRPPQTTGDTCRFRVLTGNNGAMYFSAYPEPYNHAHSLHVYFWYNLGTTRRIHRIHRRQHAFTDDTGMSKHRLSPYNAYYHNWHTLNFTTSNSSSDDRCFLKVLIVLHLTQLAGSKFQLSITLFENTYFLTFTLNLFLNSLWSCPLLSPSSSWKNNSGLISYFLRP